MSPMFTVNHEYVGYIIVLIDVTKEIEMDKISLVNKDMTMKDALNKILKTKAKVLMVGDRQKHLIGLVSLDDLTYMWTKTDKEL